MNADQRLMEVGRAYQEVVGRKVFQGVMDILLESIGRTGHEAVEESLQETLAHFEFGDVVDMLVVDVLAQRAAGSL